MGFNRYTQVVPLQFDPLSVEEIMMVPLGKQKAHLEQQDALRELGIFNEDYLKADNPFIQKEVDDLRGGIGDISEQLLKEGYNPSILQKVSSLADRKNQFLSSDGLGGKARRAYQDHKLLEEYLRKNPNVSVADASEILNYSLKRYEEEGAVSGGMYEPFYGTETVAGEQRAFDIASSIEPEALINEIESNPDIMKEIAERFQWQLTNKGGVLVFNQKQKEILQRDPSVIFDTVRTALAMDPSIQNYLETKATMKGLEGDEAQAYIDSQIDEWAWSGSNRAKVKNIANKDDIKIVPTNKGDDDDERTNGIIKSQRGPGGGFQGGEYADTNWFKELIDAENPAGTIAQTIADMKEKLDDPNTPLNEKEELLYSLNEAESLQYYSRQKARTGPNKKWTNDKLYAMFKFQGDSATNNKLADALITGIIEQDNNVVNFEGKTYRIEDGKIQIGNVAKSYNPITGETPKIKWTDIGEISENNMLELESYRREYNRLLPQSDIIPIDNLFFQPFDYAADSTDFKKIMNTIGEIFGRQFMGGEANLKKAIEELAIDGADAKTLKNYKGQFDDLEFFGFRVAKGSDKIFMTFQVPQVNDKGAITGFGAVDVPLKDVKDPQGLGASIFNALRNQAQGNVETLAAIDEMENIALTQDIIVDTNYDNENSVRYTDSQTRKIKEVLNIDNSKVNLTDADGLRIIEHLDNSLNKEMINFLEKTNDIENFDPEGVAKAMLGDEGGYSIMVNKDGKDRMYSWGDYLEELRRKYPERTPTQIAVLMTAAYSQGMFVLPETEGFPVIFDEAGNLKESYKDFPLIAREKYNLLFN